MSLDLIRVQHVARLVNGFPFLSEDFSDSNGMPLVRIRDLQASEPSTFVDPTLVPSEVVIREGDIVIGMDGDFNSVLWDREPSAMNQRVCLLRALDGHDPRFIAYALPEKLHAINEVTYSTTVKHLSSWDVEHTWIPRLSLEAQCAVADYLDCETAKIDALIAKQGALVNGLKARRRAVIRHAVLGRDRPPFKAVDVDSPWVPEVPSSWGFSSLGYRYEVVLGKMLDAGRSPREDDTDLPYIRAANIQEAGLDVSSVNFMPFTPLEAVKYALRSGDLLVVEGGSVGVSVVLEEDMEGWAFQKTVNRVRSRGDSSVRYLHYVLHAYRNAGVFSIICGGSTIAHLTAEKLSALKIPLPTLQEQQEIVDYLDRETSRIDTLIVKSERLIELSQERRSALITAAVTGRIDVREMVPSEEGA